MAKVLIVYHSLGGNTKAAAEAVAEGAKSMEGAEVALKRGFEATEEDLMGCDAVAIGSYDAFSYMAGAIKDFFDRTYYPTQDKVADKPCGIFLTHGGGGKAMDTLVKMCERFKFKQVAEPVSVKGRPNPEAQAQLVALGAKLAKA
jgi:flavorubredoxin